MGDSWWVYRDSGRVDGGPQLASVVELQVIDGGGQIVTASAASGPVLATVSPTAVAVSRQRPEGHEPNTWAGQISAVDLMGDRVRVRIDGEPEITAEVSPRAVDDLKLDDGGELWASVSPSAITVYPP